MITTNEISGKKEGIEVTIDAGFFGKFTFFGGFSEEYDEGINSRYGESTPVFRNGEYFLPWHIAAAITSNGSTDSWVTKTEESEIIQKLLFLRQLYMGKNWYDAVLYANQITGEFVY
jgi:hypothetical protein